MNLKKVQKDAISCNAAIRACSLAECWQNAMALLQATRIQRIQEIGTRYLTPTCFGGVMSGNVVHDRGIHVTSSCQQIFSAGYAAGDAEDSFVVVIFDFT